MKVGQLAMRFLRVEKFIPFWGEELLSVSTPIEVNRTFKVKLDKPSFIGKDALLNQKEERIHQRLVQFHLEEGEDFNKEPGQVSPSTGMESLWEVLPPPPMALP